jgi:cation diffusion facilitator CzcD-associated flavoprotein CzcO
MKIKKKTWIANFVIGCTGYYNYDQGYQPDFPNKEDLLIHSFGLKIRLYR